MGVLEGVEDKRHFKVPEEKSFVLCNGDKLLSLEDLVTAINLTEPEVFHTHVNEHKNDFAAWIDGVFEESAFAEKLRQNSTPLRMVITIEKFLRGTLFTTAPIAGAVSLPAPDHSHDQPAA